MSTKKVSTKRTDTMLEIQEDEDGELYIELPQKVLEQLGWNEGDTLVWYEDEKGNWNIKKATEDEQ